MIKDSRNRKLHSKEGGRSHLTENLMSSSLWPPPLNPRIVRVSREFGLKDRHSKVSTIKGLRDRRVRLSVPTAVQLYGLQDKLGLTQPSKVIDWLINAAQPEIDKLPQLQFPETWASSSAMDVSRSDELNQPKVDDSVLTRSALFYDALLFPQVPNLNSEALSYTSNHQIDPQAQDLMLTSALVSSPLASYLASTGTFDQPVSWSSSVYANTYFRQYIEGISEKRYDINATDFS